MVLRGSVVRGTCDLLGSSFPGEKCVLDKGEKRCEEGERDIGADEMEGRQAAQRNEQGWFLLGKPVGIAPQCCIQGGTGPEGAACLHAGAGRDAWDEPRVRHETL